MSITRRWFEIWLLVLGAGCLWKGLHLPPPVGDTVKVSGRVHAVTSWSDRLDFSVSTTRFSTAPPDGDFQRLQKEMTPGRDVTVEGWHWGGVPSDKHLVVVSASAGGRPVAWRSHQLILPWFTGIVMFGAGLGLTAASVQLMRRKQSAADFLREKQLREGVVEPAQPSSHERSAGLRTLAWGLAGVFGPIVIGSQISLPPFIKFVLALMPFAGLFATIVGAHRWMYGRPLTVRGTPERHIGFGTGVGCAVLLAAVAAASLLFTPK